ncbi:hypothetical protein [Reinekea sp. G2M2-21]|uniref:hypothetical protein n=1 Tax=Reinekea sp. G2M2-21 TaxID=2788942 RepID=UPI0018A95396|nr:hypothetical protein [Reinekea sp. G2M2-21]
MLTGITHLLPRSYNQTDRIQGMARYMNGEGSSSELMTLLLIFAGMLGVILVLKMISAHSQRKREAQLRKKLAQKKAAAEKSVAGKGASTTSGRGRATRLR